VAYFEVQRMRSIRLAAFALVATACMAVTPSAGAAQQQGAQSWRDSWFWGAYGGQTSFATKIARTNSAPTIGLDWVITRSRFALNVFAEQSYFNAVSTVVDSPTSADRKVDIQDMRRVGVAMMFFTPEIKIVKPYVGLGYSFDFIKQGTPQGNFFASPAARDTVLSRVNDGRTAGRMMGSLGFMVMARRFAPFAQYTVMPTKGAGGWMINGEGFTNIWTAGLRYNFGTSIEKQW
jgi:hypothetical protein